MNSHDKQIEDAIHTFNTVANKMIQQSVEFQDLSCVIDGSYINR
jgi:hypothetical protein